jgi:hypothetical protein
VIDGYLKCSWLINTVKNRALVTDFTMVGGIEGIDRALWSDLPWPTAVQMAVDYVISQICPSAKISGAVANL